MDSRRLPPPFDSSPILASRPARDPRGAPANVPRSRTSSQASTTSMASSSVVRKPAPPIPRKPPLLTKFSGRQGSFESKGVREERAIPPSMAPRIQSNIPHVEVKLSTSAQQPPSEFDGPPLPPRRIGAGARSPSELMDEDDEGASSIPSLQPTRRA